MKECLVEIQTEVDCDAVTSKTVDSFTTCVCTDIDFMSNKCNRSFNKMCLFEEVADEFCKKKFCPKIQVFDRNNNHRTSLENLDVKLTGKENLHLTTNSNKNNNMNVDSNVMIQQSMSRATEYIDISNITEHAEFSQPEVEEDEEELPNLDMEAMIKEYEALFAYSRKLRELLNIKFKKIDRSSLDTHFQLVKHHEHKVQVAKYRQEQANKGHNYDNQIVFDMKVAEGHVPGKSKKKSKKGGELAYPDWLKFFVRIKKDNSDDKWNQFTEYRQIMKKKTNGDVPTVKWSERYNREYMDVWTTNVIVFVKNSAKVSDVIMPAFSKLGLENRFDLQFTIGGFKGEQRKGKSRVAGSPKEAEVVLPGEPVINLYNKHVFEIFINGYKAPTFCDFPGVYDRKQRT